VPSLGWRARRLLSQTRRYRGRRCLYCAVAACRSIVCCRFGCVGREEKQSVGNCVGLRVLPAGPKVNWCRGGVRNKLSSACITRASPPRPRHVHQPDEMSSPMRRQIWGNVRDVVKNDHSRASRRNFTILGIEWTGFRWKLDKIA